MNASTHARTWSPMAGTATVGTPWYAPSLTLCSAGLVKAQRPSVATLRTRARVQTCTQTRHQLPANTAAAGLREPGLLTQRAWSTSHWCHSCNPAHCLPICRSPVVPAVRHKQRAVGVRQQIILRHPVHHQERGPRERLQCSLQVRVLPAPRAHITPTWCRGTVVPVVSTLSTPPRLKDSAPQSARGAASPAKAVR
jgi:hypothetical protein